MCKQSTPFRHILAGYKLGKEKKQFSVMGFSGGFYQVIGPETISPARLLLLRIKEKNLIDAHQSR
jgi:hypothetical protein